MNRFRNVGVVCTLKTFFRQTVSGKMIIGVAGDSLLSAGILKQYRYDLPVPFAFIDHGVNQCSKFA